MSKKRKSNPMSNIVKKIVEIDFKDLDYKNSMLSKMFSDYIDHNLNLLEDNYKLALNLEIEDSGYEDRDKNYALSISYGEDIATYYFRTSLLRENLEIFNALMEVLDDSSDRTVKIYNNDFERDDINRILYVLITNEARGGIYPKSICDFIYSKFLEDPSNIPIIENEDFSVDIPDEYFTLDQDSFDDYGYNFHCSLMEFQLLVDAGLLTEGLLDQELSALHTISSEQKNYCDWLDDELDKKPIFDYPFELVKQKESPFKKIFDKSKGSNLSLEF